MKTYFQILIFTMSLTFLSCNYNSNKSSISISQKTNDTTTNAINSKSDKNSFIRELKKNRVCMTDSQRADILVSGDFFESKGSKKNDYILYINYLLDHSYEGFDEAITQYTYSMFLKYPSKFKELDYYSSSLNEKQKETLLHNLAIQLISELIFKDSIANISETDFGKMFPYLKDHDCIKYYSKIKNENHKK
ncbi:MAG: hypothetical protein PHT07_16025 [Paludibacter sp.]|nr:hypothetical protein [Paludibacter sp.]